MNYRSINDGHVVGDNVMTWALIAVGIAGLVTGTRFRMQAVIVLSAVVCTATFATALCASWTFLSALGSGFVLTTVLQLSFMSGAVLTFGRNQKHEIPGRLERNAGLSEPTS
jgi:hypothetical protein